MNPPSRTTEWLVWGGLAIIIVAIAGAFVVSKLKPVNASPVYGQVADFSLTNQTGQTVSLADLRGKVWVADIIFTRCPGPCARMTRQMKQLQDALPTDSTTKLVSLTTDAEFDTPPVLERYAQRYEAIPGRWLFLTGNQREISNLAIDSLKLTIVEKQPEDRTTPEDLFIHSTIFVVVDKQARLRGIFETGGEGVDWDQSRTDILTLVHQLEREP